MALINEDKLSADLMTRFKGRILLIAACAAGAGFLIGAILF